MRTQIRRGTAALLAGVIAAAAGCARGPELAEVEGTVTLGGKPLEKIQVEFVPDGGGPTSVGTTDETGRYTLATTAGAPGAVVGPHTVVLRDVSVYPEKILGRKAENVDFSKGKKIRIPSRYGDPLHSPVKKSVDSGRKNVIDVEVK